MPLKYLIECRGDLKLELVNKDHYFIVNGNED